MRSFATPLLAFLLGFSSLALADAPAPPPENKEAKKEAKPKKAELMDINSATPDQLKTLPGITDEIAAKIVAGRPYKGKDALLKQNMVDKDGYAKIRELVIAKQPKKEAPAARAPHGASPPPPSPAPKKAKMSDDGLLGGAPGAAPPSGTH
jgi:hypothetical protein